ncbi:MAG: hypothetical protein HY867_03365 [Chloroflexi bacterium]|nr:hypothetical protein [Chloroflexota bacterium]
MQSHLFQTGQTELHGSLVALNSMQARLREAHASGLVEVRINPTRQIMIVYANGALTGSYLLENETSRPFHVAELTTLWGGAPFSVSMVPLPDRAGRAIWLVVESQKREEFEIHSTVEWTKRLEAWKEEGFSGAVEIASKSLQGFAAIHNGNLLDAESVFFNGQMFENSLPPEFDTQETWKVTSYSPSQTSHSWKCLALRSSAAPWAEGILNRYESLAGQRFLQVTSKEVGILLEPWQWKINLDQGRITDKHFFASTEATAHAYRALFMALGTQMNFVIGGSLTLRIMTEIFEELEKKQRSVLEAHRLIPAAFSN